MRFALISVLAALAWAAPASAQVSVTLPVGVLTNDPALEFAVDPLGTLLECQLEGGEQEPCTSPWRPSVSADGEYRYDVIVGGFRFGGKFTVDRTPPQLAFTAGPADGAAQLEREATFAFLAADAHLDRVECATDGAAVPCATTVALSDLAPGEHTVSVSARDRAGNETRISRRFTVVTATVIVDPRQEPMPTETATPAPAPRGDVLSSSTTSPKLKVSAKRTRAWTRLTALKLTHVPVGTAIKVTCTCLKRALRTTAKSGTVTIRRLSSRKLEPGTVLRVRVGADRVFRVTIRATKAPRISP